MNKVTILPVELSYFIEIDLKLPLVITAVIKVCLKRWRAGQVSLISRWKVN